MSSLYDQLTKKNIGPSMMMKEASAKNLQPEKIAGLAEDLAILAAEISAKNEPELPIEEIVDEEAPVEEIPAEEQAPLEGTLEETIPAENPADGETEDAAEEDKEEAEEAEVAEEEDQENEEKKEASATDILASILKQASDEIEAAMANQPAPSDELLALLEESAAEEESVEAEQMIEQLINERAMEIAADIVESPEMQQQVNATAEKIAYAIIPDILKIAGATMEDYTKGLLKQAGLDESNSNTILDEAEKIASDGLPVALVVEDIVKFASEKGE